MHFGLESVTRVKVHCSLLDRNVALEVNDVYLLENGGLRIILNASKNGLKIKILFLNCFKVILSQGGAAKNVSRCSFKEADTRSIQDVWPHPQYQPQRVS